MKHGQSRTETFCAASPARWRAASSSLSAGGRCRTATDARLRRALRAETSDATVVIVAQRVSTILRADRIIVLDEGRVVGSGTHDELMATCAEYREIVESQLGEAAA